MTSGQDTCGIELLQASKLIKEVVELGGDRRDFVVCKGKAGQRPYLADIFRGQGHGAIIPSQKLLPVIFCSEP